jgi:hypothetical protein
MPQISPIQPFKKAKVPAPPVDDKRSETGSSLAPIAEHDARSALLSDEGYDIFQNHNIAVF